MLKLWKYYYINTASPRALANTEYIQGISQEAFTEEARAPSRVAERVALAREYVERKHKEWLEGQEKKSRKQRQRRVTLKGGVRKHTNRRQTPKAYTFAPEPEYPLDDRIKLAQLVDNCISHCDHLQYYHSPQKVFTVVVDLCSKLEALEKALGPSANVADLLAEPGPDREGYNIKANIQLKAHQCRQQYIEAIASAGDLTSVEVKATRSSLKTLSSRLWH